MLCLATGHRIIISQLVLRYCASRFYRNTAFYRIRKDVTPDDALRDLGYELINPVATKLRWLGDAPKRCIGLGMMLLFVFAFVGNKRGKVKPYAVNIGLRFCEVIALGHTLRFFTYVGT